MGKWVWLPASVVDSAVDALYRHGSVGEAQMLEEGLEDAERVGTVVTDADLAQMVWADLEGT